MADASAEKKPGFLDRQRAAHPWLDHTVRTGLRYQDNKGDYYAAGITYFTVLALVPIVMVAFSIAGFVLAGRPGTLEQIQDVIAENIPGQLGDTVQSLIDSAIDSRGASASSVCSPPRTPDSGGWPTCGTVSPRCGTTRGTRGGTSSSPSCTTPWPCSASGSR